MKKSLIVVSTGVNGKINIGDYIQALAAKQFIGDADLFLERETELKDYAGDEVMMIMNGWYMNHPENWPPSDKIIPLFVALHINVCGLPLFLSKESIEYFKKHQPIGCRDTNSVKLLKNKGVDAYFSGCLTLTLGEKYRSTIRGNDVYIVEPFCETSGLIAHHKVESLKTFLYLAIHFSSVKKITKKKGERGLKALFYNAFYLKKYSQAFDYKMLVEANYVNQYNFEIQQKYPTHQEKFQYAESLLKKYASAKCVITSRIHCALPCLGLGTPVIFVEKTLDDECSKSRFGGLLNLFNVMTWTGLRLQNMLHSGKINVDNFPENKDSWREIADKLIEKCKEFTKNK